MKFLKTLGVMSALALSALAPFAMNGESLFVHVPFSFVAAGREFPAGDYRVDDNGNGMISVCGSGHTVITLSMPAGHSKPGSAPGLQFISNSQKRYLVGVQGADIIRAIAVPGEDERKLSLIR